MLYKTLEDVKSSAGFVSFSTKGNSTSILKEDLLAAEHDVRINYLGIAQFESLELAYQNDAIAADSDMEKLLEHTRRYVTMIALRTGAAKINIDFGKSGISSTKTTTAVPAREWMLVQLKNSLLQSACTHLDVLLRFLEDKRGTFALWAGDPAVNLIQRRFFLPSLTDFERYYGLSGSYITFKALWPLMDHIQERFVSKLIGQTFYDAIIAELHASNISAANQTLLKNYIYRIIAYKTILRALDTLPVQISHNGIVTNEFIANSDTTTQKKNAEMNKIRVIKEEMSFDVLELKEDLIIYLNKTASATVYSQWFNSDLYDDPSDDDEELDVNEGNNGFFAMH